MISWVRNLFCPSCFSFGTGPDCGNHEPGTLLASSPLATATTPDQLIVAHLKKSFAENYDDWKHKSNLTLSDSEQIKYIPADNTPNNILSNSKTAVVIMWFNSGYYDSEDSDFFVNGVPLSHFDGVELLEAWYDIKTAHVRAKEVALAAKRKMEANEKKWNLAESLLGMKRNEQGALVPVVQTEHCIHHENEPCSCPPPKKPRRTKKEKSNAA